MSFVRQGVGTLASRTALYAAAFFANILIARFLGPEGKGQVSLVIFTITIVIDLAAMGVPSALVFFVGQRLHDVRRLFGAGVVLYAALVVAFSLLYLAVIPHLHDTLFSKLPLWLMYFLLLAFPITSATRYAQHIALGLRQVFRFNFVSVLDRAGYVTLLLIILWGLERSVVGVVAAEVLARLISCTVALYWLLSTVKPVLGFGRKVMTSLLGYGLRAHLMLVIALISYRVGLYVLRYFHDDATVGQYSIALNVAEVLLFIPNSFGIILFSRTSGSTKEEADRFTPIAARNVLLVTIIAAAVLAIAAPVLVPLVFGRDFRPAVSPFFVLLPGVVIFALYRVLSYDIIGRGFPLRVSIASATGLLANLATAIILVPAMGAMGAAWGNFAGYVVTTIIITYIFLRLSGNRLADVIFWRRGDFRHYRNIIDKLRGSPPTEE